MAINRGTRKATFVYFVETFSILGVLAGAAWGVYQALGEAVFDLLMNAVRIGIMGFIGGICVGIVFGLFAVIWATLFG